MRTSFRLLESGFVHHGGTEDTEFKSVTRISIHRIISSASSGRNNPPTSPGKHPKTLHGIPEHQKFPAEKPKIKISILSGNAIVGIGSYKTCRQEQFAKIPCSPCLRGEIQSPKRISSACRRRPALPWLGAPCTPHTDNFRAGTARKRCRAGGHRSTRS